MASADVIREAALYLEYFLQGVCSAGCLSVVYISPYLHENNVFFCICMCISADSEHVYHCNIFVLRSLTLSPLNFYLVCLESPFSVYFTQESALFISSYTDLFYYYEVCWGQRTVGWFHNRILLFIFHSRETLKVIYC